MSYDEQLAGRVRAILSRRSGVAEKKMKSSPRLTQRIDAFLEGLDVLPLEKDCDRRYAEIRSHLDWLGRPIGPNDLLIAAHALTLDLILVTNNVEEFTRVPGLAVENWLES
jgi:tRNA(fMet)-specific endonuclease VapC